jgi:hypothetical protein
VKMTGKWSLLHPEIRCRQLENSEAARQPLFGGGRPPGGHGRSDQGETLCQGSLPGPEPKFKAVARIGSRTGAESLIDTAIVNDFPGVGGRG